MPSAVYNWPTPRNACEAITKCTIFGISVAIFPLTAAGYVFSQSSEHFYCFDPTDSAPKVSKKRIRMEHQLNKLTLDKRKVKSRHTKEVKKVSTTAMPPEPPCQPLTTQIPSPAINEKNTRRMPHACHVQDHLRNGKVVTAPPLKKQQSAVEALRLFLTEQQYGPQKKNSKNKAAERVTEFVNTYLGYFNDGPFTEEIAEAIMKSDASKNELLRIIRAGHCEKKARVVYDFILKLSM